MKLYPLYSNQILLTTSSPTFAGLSLGTGELTCGSINRASGTLTLEIAGTAEISITATTTTFGGNLLIPNAGYIGSASDTTALRIEADGDILLSSQLGIGITPTSALHLFSTTAAIDDPQLIIENDSSYNSYPSLLFKSSEGANQYPIGKIYGGFFDGSGWANTAFVLQSVSGGTLIDTVVLNQGDVGIGTTKQPTGTLSIGDYLEGGTASLNVQTAHETHTLTLGASSVTTTLDIPTTALVLGAAFCVNTAVTDTGGNDTWSAAFSGGDASAIVAAVAAAQNTKAHSTVVPALTNAETEITFTPNGGNFGAGIIEVIAWYIDLTDLANV